MSFSASGGNGGRPGMMSEINVTPLVDVMLVLLIIFMVTAPMMTQGLDVNLPNVDASPLPTEQEQTILTVKANGEILLDEFVVTETNLAFQVAETMKTKGNQTVFLKADQATPYGTVAGVMGQLRQAGITSIGLVTDPADRTPPPQDDKAPRPGTGPRGPAN